MAVKIFIVTSQTHASRKARGSPTKCKVCKKEIKINDSVVTKRTRTSGTLIRHEDCARQVGIID